jgi:hypothetical protein
MKTMSSVARKKQIGMYTFALDSEGTLSIQAPTLLKPVVIEAKQARELIHWLADAQQIELAPATPPPAELVTSAPAITTAQGEAAIATAPPTQPVAERPAETSSGTEAETPESLTRRIIQQQVAVAREQRPENLALERRDLLIEQITRVSEIRPLISQGKVSWKKIMLWVNQEIEG